jgi:hypothetical protein
MLARRFVVSTMTAAHGAQIVRRPGNMVRGKRAKANTTEKTFILLSRFFF